MIWATKKELNQVVQQQDSFNSDILELFKETYKAMKRLEDSILVIAEKQANCKENNG